jgi:hypothetical protein
MNRMTFLSSRRVLAGLSALASVVVALAGPSAASAEDVTPQVNLGPTTVLNGVAVVRGTVRYPSPGVQLTINRAPVSVAAGGSFVSIVNLDGQRVLSLSLTNLSSGGASTVTIPLDTNLLGLDGLLAPDVLTALGQSGVSILRPAAGFIPAGDTIAVGGSVGSGNVLATLSINGVDAMSVLQPNGSFLVPVPGTTKEIHVFMADKQGVSLETSYRTSSSVSASAADGVRVAKVRYFAKSVKRTKRLRVVVTVRDRENRLVHGASVTLRSRRSGRIFGRAFLRSTNLNGKAKFVLRVRRAALGRRSTFMVIAKTPNAKATKRTSVRLPRRGSTRGR